MRCFKPTYFARVVRYSCNLLKTLVTVVNVTENVIKLEFPLQLASLQLYFTVINCFITLGTDVWIDSEAETFIIKIVDFAQLFLYECGVSCRAYFPGLTRSNRNLTLFSIFQQNFISEGMCYKTFYGCNLLIFVIS